MDEGQINWTCRAVQKCERAPGLESSLRKLGTGRTTGRFMFGSCNLLVYMFSHDELHTALNIPTVTSPAFGFHFTSDLNEVVRSFLRCSRWQIGLEGIS